MLVRIHTRWLLVTIALMLCVLTWPAMAQEGQSSLAMIDLDVRTGPGTRNTVIGQIERETEVMIEARSPGDGWMLIRVDPDGLHGWVIADGLLLSDVDLAVLPTTTALAVLPLAGEEASAELTARISALNDYLGSPTVMPTLTEHAAEIIARGRELGLNPRLFTTVGDCHTDNLNFLRPFGNGDYDLGSYTALQETLDYFMISPRPDVANAFVNRSLAAAPAFSTGAVLDPTWANPTLCQPGETPLACEYRLVQPSIALILLGTKDIHYYTLDDFRTNIELVVEQTLEHGILPVLGTFPIAESYYLYVEALEFNAVLVETALKYEVPLINYWVGLFPLPNHGMHEDGIHILESEDPNSIAFSESDLYRGMVQRNLITLEALELLRQTLLPNAG
jgi:hypothetical protein